MAVLDSLTTGSDNTAYGGLSLFSDTSGSDNTAAGFHSLLINANGSQNTAYGSGALSASTGGNNIALGYNAGDLILGGSGNIDIGNRGLAGDTDIIRIGTPGIQTNTLIAGVINGNGGGLTNLNASQLPGLNLTNVSGALPSSTTYSVTGNQSGGWGSSVLQVENANTSGTASPALRVVGYGDTFNGALSVSAQGSGLIAQFGNANAFVSSLDTNGNWIANSFTGNGSGLTGLNASQLTGTLTGDGSGLINLNASQLTSIGSPGNSDNFFVGPAGSSATTGEYNTGSGQGALASLTTGDDNTAYGTGALHINTSGADNTSVGFNTLHVIPNGSQNTALGSGALSLITSGNNNIALGYIAGQEITTGSGNIDIGNRGLSTDTDIIRIGTPGVQTNTVIAGVINGNGGGLTNLNAAQMSGSAVLTSLTLPTITAGSPNVIYSGTNLLMYANTNGNFFSGLAAGSSSVGGTNNTGIGDDALAILTTSRDNTAVGYEALSVCTNGIDNTAVGSEAQFFNQSGSDNTAVGYSALWLNGIYGYGDDNTAVGSDALIYTLRNEQYRNRCRRRRRIAKC